VGMTFLTVQLASRVSFETSFDSKQPKLEQKLVSALSETESFSVSIEPKQTEEQLKQFDRKLILLFFSEFRVYPVCFCLFWFVSKQFLFVLVCFKTVSVCFGLFRNSLFRLFGFYTKTESFDVLIETKQTEEQQKQFDRELIYFGIFSENLGFIRFVSVCYGLF
jgi:hypothetical protein